MLTGKKGGGRIEVGELRDSVLRKVNSMIKGRNRVIVKKGLISLGKIWRLYFNDDVLDKIIRVCRKCGKETDVSDRCNRSHCKECDQREVVMKEERKQIAERICLTCDKLFISISLYDRRCDKCEEKDELVNSTIYHINIQSAIASVKAE